MQDTKSSTDSTLFRCTRLLPQSKISRRTRSFSFAQGTNGLAGEKSFHHQGFLWWWSGRYFSSRAVHVCEWRTTNTPGNNEGANPVEFLLHALAGCVTTTLVLHAAARGIQIQELSTTLEGDLDLHGLLGLDDSVSPGYEQIRIKMNVKADCSDEELDKLLAFSREHSPVCQSVCRPVPVSIERVNTASAS